MIGRSLLQARFYAILDTGYVSKREWTAKCRQLLAGGADLVQLRAKRETTAEREDLLLAILPMFAGTKVPLVINDDIDLCLKYPQLGLHVGQEDLPPAEARRSLGPDRLLGLSTHSREQALSAIGLGPGVLSYFAVGPVFSTPTKPDYTPVGLDLVRWVGGLEPALPFFCIGGISRKNARQVVETGGKRIVVVSDVLRADNTADAVRELRNILEPIKTPRV